MPAVGVIVNALVDLVHDKAAEEGMPALRLAFTYTPVGGKTPAELAEYIKGKDPVTGQPLMQEIVGDLTRPLNDEEKKTGTYQRTKNPLIGPDTAANIQQYFDDRFWSDQLPIIMPTEERVAEMLAHTSHKRDEIIGKMRVTGTREAWEYTVETVAINAVMAGRQTRVLPRHSRDRGHADDGALELDVVDGVDGRVQWPDRHRAQHELGDRRARAL